VIVNENITNTLPLVSVLMTAYNRENYITEAIESVLNSDYQNLELLVVDDCSNDQTLQIARLYGKSDSRLRVYQNETNLGDYANRNKAASYATGEFLVFVDSDDKILPNGFSKLVATMQHFPKAGMGMLMKGSEGEPYFLSPNEAIRKHFFSTPCLMIGPGGTILRRSFFEAIGKYPVKYGPANDLYFNLKAAAGGGMVFLPFEFNFYRIHEGQEINNQYSYLFNNYRYLRDALGEIPLPLSVREKEWIGNKNKRRFLVNLANFFWQSKNIFQTAQASKLAGFGWKEFWKAIVHPAL
jgi:glycosyltransferase involved in cell wall biosynthesis